MKNLKFEFAALVLATAATVSCDLTEKMQVDADKAMIFGTETGLQTYAYSLYKGLPNASSANYLESGKCDYCACNQMNEFFMDGAFTAETSTGWSWTNLHNINYFLDGLKSPECVVPDAVKRNYEGIARWFRAWFYYDKFTKYGPVPWYDHCIQNYETDLLYKNRDSRDIIVENMIADLDFAFENITAKSSTGSSLVTKWCAAALKSRICLFEASYRKYHSESGKYTPEQLFTLAAEAARLVIDGSGYGLNTTAYTNGSYRDLFTSEDTITKEVLLNVCCSSDAGILGNQNWKYNSASYGNHLCFSRVFINTFLMKDGSAFTSKSGYATTDFRDEFTDRDTRLAQIVRGPSYRRDNKAVVPDIVNQVAMTGYHPIKFSLDETKYDNAANNINGTPIIRFAEVLLNYAEAKAELGTLTDKEWSSTIGAIRSRGGITGGISTLPTVTDAYMKSNFYPSVTDPVIMEIRRERAIELCLEGFRMFDLIRWGCGNLIEKLPWTGIHFSSLDTGIDLNGDGTFDVYFSETPKTGATASYKDIWVTVNDGSGLYAVTNPDGGYDLEYHVAGQRKWYSDDRQYLYPIPAKIIRDYAAEGYTMTQNPNWQ